MPSYDESRIPTLQRKVADFRKRQAEQETIAAKAEAGAVKYDREAQRTSTPGLAASKRRSANTERDKVTNARKKAAGLAQDAARAQKDLNETERRVQKKRESDDKRRQYQDKREREKAEAERKRQERERQRQDRDRQRQERQEKLRDEARDQELSDLRLRTAVVEVRLQRAAPKKIKVVFIAASPEDEDLDRIRPDREAREIQRRVRESQERDSIDFEIRPATQVTDLIQILSETRPHVVHFAGHGSEAALVFEDDDGLAKELPNDRLAALLRALSDRIHLVVFNSCDSAEQAALACDHLDAAIGMDQPVSDEEAKIFAGAFYNAIGFGRSVQDAYDLAKLQVELTTDATSGEPQLHVAEGVDASLLYLVAPPNGNG